MVALQPNFLRFRVHDALADMGADAKLDRQEKMGDVVNLNQFRKQRERLERKKAAAANRAKFGRAKGDVVTTKKSRERDKTKLDGKRLKDTADTDDTPDAV